MAAFATVADVAVRLGDTYDTTQTAQLNALLDDVSALIRARRPQIDAWIAAGTISDAIVRAVTVQVTARMLTTIATGGVGLRAEQHPEYSYELASNTAAGLNLTNRELAQLTPPVGRSRPFSVQPTF